MVYEDPIYIAILKNQMIATPFYFIRKCVVGTVSFGLFIGALYFLHYLFGLSQMDKKSRQYRQQRQHMHPETLLRYTITIACIIILNILFYSYFDFGKECTFIGIIIWGIYFVSKFILKFAKKRIPYKKLEGEEKKKNLQKARKNSDQNQSTSTCIQNN